MDIQELNRRLLEIVKGTPTVTITERACWLDGEECPYGRPEGQLLKRPTVFCRPQSKSRSGCLKLNDHCEELYELMNKSLCYAPKEEIYRKVEKAVTKVSSELGALADQATSCGAKELLKIAAELIEKKDFGLKDREIVLLEDLELGGSETE